MGRQPFSCVVVMAATAFLLLTTPAFAKSLEPDPVPDAWLRAHADASNGGFANVVTAPAARIAQSTASLGTIAFGAGPVIGQDGTVYIGNRQGTLFAFHADGSKAWSRQLPPGQEILASPAVGADGSIYVIGVSMVTDDRVTPPFVRPDSTLHKFLPGGGYLWNVPFPEPSAALPISNGRGGTTAPPALGYFGGIETVMVPVVYVNRLGVSRAVRVLAFSTEGPAVLGDILVTNFPSSQVTGGCPDDLLWCIIPLPGFEGHGVSTPVNPDDQLPAGATAPMPGAAIYLTEGGMPWILVSDQRHDIGAFTFAPQSGFTEVGRIHDESLRLASAPLVLPNTMTVVGGYSGAASFRGRDIRHPQIIKTGGTSLTRLADGKTIIAAGWDGFQVVRLRTVSDGDSWPGRTMVAPAASRSHIFFSTASAFYTYDATTLARLAKLDWRGGGVSPPAIGPRGDVYAVAGNKLYVFPRPCIACGLEPLSATMPPDDGPSAPAVQGDPGSAPQTGEALPLSNDVMSPEPGAPVAPQPAPTSQGSNKFKKPTGPAGLRLYACTVVGGNECGRPVADAFCQAQGWAEADKYDIDSKKEQAETLSGEVCTKNKCKMFDYIECEN